MTRDGSLVYAVVNALAEAEEVEPTELGFNLSEWIDPEALALLAAMDGSTWEFTFEVPDHTVTIAHDGSVIVDEVVYRNGVRSVDN